VGRAGNASGAAGTVKENTIHVTVKDLKITILRLTARSSREAYSRPKTPK
jgi:hypothetical protein